jgi:putative MATE family efflux protein
MKGTKNLTEGPILRILFALATPIMATMFMQMAYSLTDMAWVGRLGSEAIAAVGSVSILTWMSSALTYLGKVSAEVSVAQAIGGRDERAARLFASHSLTVSLLVALVWGAGLFALAQPIIGIYQLEGSIASEAVRYLRITSTALPFVFLSATCTGIFNASGRSSIPFLLNGIGLGCNMLLDPLFIFGFGWGTAGAAWATWLSEALVCLLYVYRLKYRNQLWERFTFFCRLQREATKRIFQLGTPVALLNILFAFVSMFLGRTATEQGGHLGLMALTIGGNIEAITWNTAQGFSTALSAFVAQNFATRSLQRILRAYKATLGLSFVFGAACTVLFVCFGHEVFSLFVPEAEATEVGGEFLRIDGYSQLFMMCEITTQGMFYGLGRTVPPAVISVSCNYLRIPMALGFVALGWGLAGIWWAICLSSILKGLAGLIWLHAIGKKEMREK